jgi:lipoate-protein ligase A
MNRSVSAYAIFSVLDVDHWDLTRRGEFKTPGGKLIAVEFSVDAGRLRDVVVTGDFFLYPEEALPSLAAALEGSPVGLTAVDYADRVRPALQNGVELLGSSPEALGAAVVRAVRGPEAVETSDGG